LVLSGILKNQSKDVIHAYLDWIKLSIVEDLDGWVLIAGQL
jgi:ribosomal protein L11 methylase PrmA